MQFAMLQSNHWLKNRLESLQDENNNLARICHERYDDLKLCGIGTIELAPKADTLEIWVALGEIFRVFQNIPEEFSLDTNVKVLFREPMRSADIGDVIQFGNGDLYKVKAQSYQKLRQNPVLHISETINNRALVAKFSCLSNWTKDVVVEQTVKDGFLVEKCSNEGNFYHRVRTTFPFK